jgi:hypothetical protein
LASWLETIITKSAQEMELARKTVFQFARSIHESLAKCPIQEWEETAWARGLKTGLIRLEGYFFRVGSGKKSPLSFFIRNNVDLYVGLRRESVTQAATYVSLVTDYGYERNRTRFESRWMDVAVYGPDGHAWIYAENKANKKTLEKLCARLASEFTQGIPAVDLEKKVIDDALMKAHHIWKNRPPYFWAVCPTEKLSFSVRYESAGFTLEPSAALPAVLEWS